MRLRAAVLLLAMLAVARPARADGLQVRQTGLHWRQGQLSISVGVQDLLHPEDVERLTSGFATRVVIQVEVVRAQDGAVVAQTFRATEILYDLWGEKFRVSRLDAHLPPVWVDSAPDAVFAAAALVMFPVTDLTRLQPGVAYRINVRADLNPLSREVVAELRRWLARPPGQGRLGPGASFFGSFVSIFVNPHIEDSDRRVEFVSQSFTEPSP